MAYYEEHTEGVHVSKQEELVVTNEKGERVPMNFQPAFDVLKSLNLDQHISEDERRFLRVE